MPDKEITIDEAVAATKAFQEERGGTVEQPIARRALRTSRAGTCLQVAIRVLRDAEHHLKAAMCQACDIDDRLLRAELHVSETRELIEALLSGDEVELLDALADILYVTCGSAARYRLPLAAAFVEVHRSNMTKTADAVKHLGDKGKAAGFSPANITAVLAAAK